MVIVRKIYGLLVVLMLTGCNTMDGLNKDLKDGGDKVRKDAVPVADQIRKDGVTVADQIRKVFKTE
jgi:predicted small secreted protein